MVSRVRSPHGARPTEDGLRLGGGARAWSFRLGVACAFAVSTFLIGSPAAAQRITEFPVPAVENSLSAITPGPDGALWYTVRYAGRVDRIETSGSITSPFNLPGSDPYGGITSGPDGALWFTDPGGERIRRVTLGGASSEFPIGRSPLDIANGPDGALWFVDGNVGRLATDGTITRYDSAAGSRITAGPDGALWTLGSSGGMFKLTRIATSGIITEFALPLPAATYPSRLVTGPDGALWFTLLDENKIARSTVAGAYSEFVLPTPARGPAGIASGPDGALWFTEALGNRIGRITTSGAITEYLIPTLDSAPYGIATGADGNLWFVESYGSVVARLEPNRPAGLDFATVSPCRLVDTRDSVAPRGGPALQSAIRRDFHLTEACGIPPGAVSVAVNVTAVGATSAGDLRLFPPAFHDGRTSLLNYAAGQTRAANGVLRLGPFGDLTLLPGMANPGKVDVVIDVVGYFQ